MSEDYFVPYLVALRVVRSYFGLPEIAESRELDELYEGAVQLALEQLVRERQIKVRLLVDIDKEPTEPGRDAKDFKVGWLHASWQDSEWHQGDLEDNFGPTEGANSGKVRWPWYSQKLPDGFVFTDVAVKRSGGSKQLLRMLRLRFVRGFYFQVDNRTHTSPLPWDIWYSTHADPILKTGIVWTPSMFLHIPIYCPLVFKEQDIATAASLRPATKAEPAWVSGPATHEVNRSRGPGGRPRKWDWEQARLEIFRIIHVEGITKTHQITPRIAEWFASVNDAGDHPAERNIRDYVQEILDVLEED